MNHKDHVDLLHGGVVPPNAVWADLGCGTGAFALALADMLDPQSIVYAVDTDKSALAELRRQSLARFPSQDIRPTHADFTQPLDLPPLDGVVMANSLHFHKEKEPIVRAVRDLLKPDGRLILIEYNVDRGNPWVPFPVSFGKWAEIALRCGFGSTEKIAAKRSSFLREIYSALSQ
jgi:SAM-dependent methyltransferase